MKKTTNEIMVQKQKNRLPGIIVVPVYFLLVIIQMFGLFLNRISGVISGILCTCICVPTIICCVLGVASKTETIYMLGIGFLLFMVPHAGNWILEQITVWQNSLLHTVPDQKR